MGVDERRNGVASLESRQVTQICEYSKCLAATSTLLGVLLSSVPPNDTRPPRINDEEVRFPFGWQQSRSVMRTSNLIVRFDGTCFPMSAHWAKANRIISKRSNTGICDFFWIQTRIHYSSFRSPLVRLRDESLFQSGNSHRRTCHRGLVRGDPFEV